MPASRKSKTAQVTAVPHAQAPRPVPANATAPVEPLRALQLSIDTRQ